VTNIWSVLLGLVLGVGNVRHTFEMLSVFRFVKRGGVLSCPQAK
jgi:glycosylphosphatidylinositol transamidase (GPIT) subunit GPI8